MSMKTLLLTTVVSVLASLPLMAEQPLKLELLAPKEPVTLSKADLEKSGAGLTLSYRITNTGKKDVVIKHGGDESTNSLSIEGPGALNRPYNGPMTADYRMGQAITIKPGESKEFEIKGLKHGTRDMSYWKITKAGDYEASMTFVSRLGREKLTLKSSAVKFSVVVK